MQTPKPLQCCYPLTNDAPTYPIVKTLSWLQLNFHTFCLRFLVELLLHRVICATNPNQPLELDVNIKCMWMMTTSRITWWYDIYSCHVMYTCHAPTHVQPHAGYFYHCLGFVWTWFMWHVSHNMGLKNGAMNNPSCYEGVVGHHTYCYGRAWVGKHVGSHWN